MSKAIIDRTIQQDFGKSGEQNYKAYLRLVRRAVFSDAPAAFPACIRLAELARARGWSRTGAWVRHHMERRFLCYVHPHAEIGPGLCTPHPVGIVIGAGCRVARGVTLYQNVTLGTNDQASYLAGEHNYPTLGDCVTCYAGAVAIGAIQIADGVVVGANAVVTKDMPAGCVAVGVPAIAKMRRVAVQPRATKQEFPPPAL